MTTEVAEKKPKAPGLCLFQLQDHSKEQMSKGVVL